MSRQRLSPIVRGSTGDSLQESRSKQEAIEVPVAEITADLQNGLRDAELMKKYALSANGLRKLFDRLLRAISTGGKHILVESDTSEPR